MKVIDYAISMEAEGEKFYNELSIKAENTGLKNILKMLAEDENKHRKIFEKIKNESKTEYKKTEILGKAELIFKSINIDDFLNQKDQAEIYKKAQSIEQKSIDFYTEQINAIADKNLKDIISKILDEEKIHYYLLDNIIELLMHPKLWVEHAEFFNKDENY